MILTPRIGQILLILLKQDEPMSEKNLADEIQVSKRTVQREIAYIDNVLQKYGIKLCSKTGVGIWTEGEQAYKQSLIEEIQSQSVSEYVDKDFRRESLKMELLKASEPRKLYYFANKFAVSDSTVRKDLERIEPWFGGFNIKIDKKPGRGVALIGREIDFRNAIKEFLAKHIDEPTITKLINRDEGALTKTENVKAIKEEYKFLNHKILDRVVLCFESISNDEMNLLTNQSYIGLILHTTIAIERVENGEVIEYNEELTNRLIKEEEYDLAMLIVDSIEDEFSLEMPDAETTNICLHIMAAKKQVVDTVPDGQEIGKLVQQMIVEYDPHMALELLEDEALVQGLEAHLKPTIIRIRHHMKIVNPHLDQLKQEYPEVYKKCENASSILASYVGEVIPDAEVGFLAFHFGAAVVRRQNRVGKRRKVAIGLVCGSGIGVSRLMVSKIEKVFGQRVELSAYGIAELTPYVIERNDFFVSNLDLSQLAADVLVVIPLLPESDLKRIDQKISAYEYTPKKNKKEPDFIKKMDELSYLSSTIKDVIGEFRVIKLSREGDFEELVNETVGKLVVESINEKRVREALLEREQLATQILPELGIGLLHAKTFGVHKPQVAVAKPITGEHFTDEHMQGARSLLIMLAPSSSHKQENANLLGYISQNLIEDDQLLDVIRKGNEQEIRAHLTRLLKQYFNQYLERIE